MIHPLFAMVTLASACASATPTTPPSTMPPPSIAAAPVAAPAPAPPPAPPAAPTAPVRADDDVDGHVEHAAIADTSGLRVELAWHTRTGTMHVAQEVSLVAANGTLHLVGDALGRDPHVPELHDQPLPLVERVLAAGASRWIVLGWSSPGEGMQSEHAWLVDGGGAGGPRIVDSIVWTSTRRAAGVAIDTTGAPRIGIPLPGGSADDSSTLQHRRSPLALVELRNLPAHATPLGKLAAYYTPPEQLSPTEHGWTGRFVWFDASAHGFEAR